MGALGCGLGYFGMWNLGRLSERGRSLRRTEKDDDWCVLFAGGEMGMTGCWG